MNDQSRRRVPDERSALAQRLDGAFADLDLNQRLAAVRGAVEGRIVFTTSFGLEDQAISHAIFTQDLAIDVVTFDTGRLFPETHAVWAETEQRYGQRIRALLPARAAVEDWIAQHGIDGFRSSVAARQSCCSLRKVEPLGRALAGAAGWVTGVRAEQSAERAMMSFVAADAQYGLIKLNPLLDWTRDRVARFVRDHRIPYNSLHDRGFLSIGCAPCTRAVAPDEPERAGRWWWEQQEKKECGLHLASAPALVH
ncbi:MAG TPA: phosphoadenylyl-sulfate reductase [Xanthobacteraceae bacterium]|jgi:phosphoadenosine phosphosulfate reductase|nr:phosphoadenylyl-sulfate reductase [Xanthobacteraceae bacterium]